TRPRPQAVIPVNITEAPPSIRFSVPTSVPVPASQTQSKSPFILGGLGALALFGGGIGAYMMFIRGQGPAGGNPPAIASPAVSSAAPTASAVPTAAPRRTECPSDMVLVSGGRFYMGSDDASFKLWQPAHKVTLDTFCIDTYEV